MQFVQTPQKTQTKTNKAHRCIYVSFQVIVFHYKQNTLSTHKQRNKTKTKKKKKLWSKKVYTNKNQLAISKSQQNQGWCLLSFFYRREFDQALGKVRDLLLLFWISMYRYLHSIKQRRRSQRWGPGSLGPSCLGADKVCRADWVGWRSAGMEWESGCPWV